MASTHSASGVYSASGRRLSPRTSATPDVSAPELRDDGKHAKIELVRVLGPFVEEVGNHCVEPPLNTIPVSPHSATLARQPRLRSLGIGASP